MITSIGRRLRVAFTTRPEPEPESSSQAESEGAPGHSTLPLVEFVAYAEDCILSGRVRLAAERLTDMLNDHDEVQLIDVMVERFDGGEPVQVPEVLVKRDELYIVHATGPRGSAARRHRTRQHPVAVTIDRYQVEGYLHALPGADPLDGIRRRKPMVPLTDAIVEYGFGADRERRRAGVVVVNRDMVESIAPARERQVEMPDMPVTKQAKGKLLKDFTGVVRDLPTPDAG